MPSPSTLLRTRWIIIGIHLLVTAGFFILSFLHDSFLYLICVFSFLPFLIYIPAAIWYGRQNSTRTFDRAGAEVAYLSVQMAWWMALIVLGLYYAGPNECARWSYELGRAQASNPELSDGPGLNDAVIDSCDLDTLLNVFSCLHFVLLAAWTGYIIYRVRKLPMKRREGFKCGVSRILRGEYDIKPKDVELGSMANSSSLGGTNVTTTTMGDIQPPALPPRPEPIVTTIQIENVTEIPPPAYEPQTAETSPRDGVGRGTMDFDTFMRVQQTRMEEKLALHRERRGTPDERWSPIEGSSEGWGAGPSTARRRRSA